jgi:hypothetical protein
MQGWRLSRSADKAEFPWLKADDLYLHVHWSEYRDNINTMPSCTTTHFSALLMSRNTETTFVGYAALLDRKASLEAVVFTVGK